jgi:site-specific recombinase XerD
MSRRQKLQHALITFLNKDRRGSFSTRATRKQNLMNFVQDLFNVDIQLRTLDHLRDRHVDRVVNYWMEEGLSVGTVKNRLSALRHLCEAMGKSEIVRSNSDYGLPKRDSLPTFNRAIFNPDLSVLKDEHIRISTELQRVFGLRRAESMKIKPFLADKGDTLEMYPSWCKGGRGRFIPIRTADQRYWLNEAKRIAGKIERSMIPQEKSFDTQLSLYEKQVQRAGMHNLHGLRHAYAQDRYKELTGWEAPINGGPTYKELTPEQKIIDHNARIVVTEALGHSRKSITNSYCGR